MAEVSAARFEEAVLAVANRGFAQGSPRTLARQMMAQVVEPLVSELRRTEGDLAVAVHEAVEVRAKLAAIEKLVRDAGSYSGIVRDVVHAEQIRAALVADGEQR